MSSPRFIANIYLTRKKNFRFLLLFEKVSVDFGHMQHCLLVIEVHHSLVIHLK
jgi:hypothetical protein